MEENNENLENKISELENKVMELEQQLSESESMQKEQYERLLRSEADFQNLKKRTEKEKEDTKKYALQEVIMGILNVLDHIERGIKAYKDSEKELLDREEVLMGLKILKTFYVHMGYVK